MGLFDIYRNYRKRNTEKLQQTFEGPTIFYHEDDYRQVEIIPNDNLSILRQNQIRSTYLLWNILTDQASQALMFEMTRT